MKYYIDAEFDGHNGPLLSIAVVRDDGDSIHIRTTNKARDPWVLANVMPHMNNHEAFRLAHVAELFVGHELRAFMQDDDCPHVIADSPVDIARFCTAFMTDSEGSYLPNTWDRLSFDVCDVTCYPTDLPGAVQHNAWWDAMALRERLAARTQEARHDR